MSESVQIRNPALVNWLSGDLQPRYESSFAWKVACSAYLCLPVLRGFWPMSIVAAANPQVVDASGIGGHLTNTGAEFGYDALVPYAVLDGGDDLAHADAGDFDILGTEAYVEVAYRGLTTGIWVYPTAIGATQAVIGKWDAGGNQRSYLVELLATNFFRFSVSVDGTAVVSVDSTVSVSADTWYYVEGMFDPSTRLAIDVNGTIDQNVAAIPASVFNSNAEFNIGAQDNGTVNRLSGKVSLAQLCASYHGDTLSRVPFWHTCAMFGVQP